MFKNYLIIALRNLWKQKLYTAITILGMSVGLAVFILFWLIANVAFTSDEFHKNANRIYGIIQVVKSGDGTENQTAITPAPLLNALLDEFPEIEDGVRFFPADRSIVSYNGNNFYEDQILFVDPNFLSFFTFRTTDGDPETMLKEKNTIVLSEEIAQKLFGEKNPIGQLITLNNQLVLTVTGVVENCPYNSSINYECLVPLQTVEHLYDWADDWKTNTQATFILLKKGVDPDQFQQKFGDFINKYYPSVPDSPKKLYLMPITDFLFETIGIETFLDKNFPIVSYLLIICGIVLLLIVCINYMSLATARYTNRAREVGIRKVVGASRSSLIKQFLSESIFITLIAFPFGILVFEFALYLISNEWWTANYISLYDNPGKLIILLLIVIVVGVFAGSYPAFFLSSFRPVKILKGTFQPGKKGSGFRKIIVVTQFSLAIILIVFAVVVNKQFNHILDVDFGYNRKNIMAVRLNSEARVKLDLLKNEIKKQPGVIFTSSSISLPCQWNNETRVTPQGLSNNESWVANIYGIDYYFIEMYEMGIIRGRSFAEEYTDSNSFVINQLAAKQFGWDDPIGKEISIGDKKGRVIGVVKDFLFKDMHFPIIPSVLYLEKNDENFLLVKYSGEDAKVVAEKVKKIWKEYLPDFPFEYVTNEQYFFDIYAGFNLMGMLCGAVGIIGIFLACLGILALAAYAVENRTKEIGVRRVLGASEVSVVNLFIKDFLKWIILSNLIALPISYLISKQFLEWVSVYRVSVGVEILLGVAIGSLIISLLAVVSQTLRAATANPIESLKYE